MEMMHFVPAAFSAEVKGRTRTAKWRVRGCGFVG